MEGGFFSYKSVCQNSVDRFAHFFVGGGADDLVLDDTIFVKDDCDGPGRSATQTLEEGVALVITAVDEAGIGG